MPGFASRPVQPALFRWAIAALTIGLASHAGAQQHPATEAPSDVELRWQIEGRIQQCIRDRIETPKMCRLAAYAAALAAGFPPNEATRITGYVRSRDKQP